MCKNPLLLLEVTDFFVYICSNDSVANDYRFVICEGWLFSQPFVFYIAS